MSDLNYLKSYLSETDSKYLDKAYYRYTQTGWKETKEMLSRIPLYEAEIDHALQQYDIPQWVKYLTLAESRLLDRAVSPAGAAGLWQIMPATGRGLGLRINDYTDERLHTGKASMAAAQYLNQLHQQFGDWLLALAAYNCGAGNVRKAQRRSKGYFYHEISRYLPRQTRRYIPRVLTIASIAQDPATHGFTDIRYKAAPVLVSFSSNTSFDELATYFCASKRQLQRFNPAFLTNRCRLDGDNTATIYLPASVFQSPYRTTVMQIRNDMTVQTVQRVYDMHPQSSPQFATFQERHDKDLWAQILAFSYNPGVVFNS